MRYIKRSVEVEAIQSTRRRGAPIKDVTRSMNVTIRMSPREHEYLGFRSKASGISKAKLIRAVLFEHLHANECAVGQRVKP